MCGHNIDLAAVLMAVSETFSLQPFRDRRGFACMCAELVTSGTVRFELLLFKCLLQRAASSVGSYHFPLCGQSAGDCDEMVLIPDPAESRSIT